MQSTLKSKKEITVHLNRIDLDNIRNGESLKALIKASFETEIPYELVVKLDGEKAQNYTQ